MNHSLKIMAIVATFASLQLDARRPFYDEDDVFYAMDRMQRHFQKQMNLFQEQLDVLHDQSHKAHPAHPRAKLSLHEEDQEIVLSLKDIHLKEGQEIKADIDDRDKTLIIQIPTDEGMVELQCDGTSLQMIAHLTIKHEKTDDHGTTTVIHQGSSAVSHYSSLPARVDISKARIEYTDGLLTIILPKKEAKKIPVVMK